VHLQTNVSLWRESRFCFYFHIWTTEVIPYNARNSEFANLKTPCISFKKIFFFKFLDWNTPLSHTGCTHLYCTHFRRKYIFEKLKWNARQLYFSFAVFVVIFVRKLNFLRRTRWNERSFGKHLNASAADLSFDDFAFIQRSRQIGQ
jgi:hypothetical protein